MYAQSCLTLQPQGLLAHQATLSIGSLKEEYWSGLPFSTPGDLPDPGLPRWCSITEFACQCKRHKRHSLIPGLGRSPGVGNGNPLQYSCLENSMDRGAWQATILGVTQQAHSRYVFKQLFGSKSDTDVQTSLVAQTVKRLPTIRETRVRSLGWEDPLEKEMATHSSTLAWKIPWTEEPEESMGSQRVRHN